jgi:hypothetical protein
VANDGSRQRKRDFRTAVKDAKAVATVLAMEAESVFGKRTARFLAVLGAFAIAIVMLLIFLDWYIDPSTPAERKDLILTLAQILGGAALLSGLYFTWRTLQVNGEGQITERFTRAIDQLGETDDDGNPRLEIRLGGIYALERIARDSPERDYSTVMEVLTAYVRGNAPWHHPQSFFGALWDETDMEANLDANRDLFQAPRADVQAILDVLGRREEDRIPMKYRVVLNLESTDLRAANLSKANLAIAMLAAADFSEANLTGADLRNAVLQYANLRGANLANALLSYAHLQGVDLSETIGLTQEGIQLARGNEETKLPNGLQLPADWRISTNE